MFFSTFLQRALLAGAAILATVPQSTVLANPTRHMPDIDISVRRLLKSDSLSRRAISFDSYTALGDSFSAGPSAGNQRNVDSTDYDCSRYDQAFPMQLSANGAIPGSKTLQFLACTGAKMPDVIGTQLPSLDAGAELITLTIGGNDVGFASILNDCLYYFYPSTWSCQNVMDWATTTMQSSAFADSYNQVIQGIWATAPTAQVYVIGYPAFFNTDTTQCSTTCFKFGAPCETSDYLTTQFRSTLNALTESLNGVISGLVNNNPPPPGGGLIQYINPDTGYNGHRFCEDGITEPDYNNPNGWFYPFTWFKRDFWTQGFDNTTSCENLYTTDTPYTGEIGTLVACGIYENSTLIDALNADDALASTTYPDPDGVEADSITPACFQRIFHPTIAGMTSFMNDVVDAISNPVLPVSVSPSPIPSSSPIPIPSSSIPPPVTPTSAPPAPSPTVNNLCNLGNYPDPTMGPINDGMAYLQGKAGTQFCVAANSCGRPSCSYGTGISVCNNQDTQICVDLGDIGTQAYAAQEACQVDTTCTSDVLVCGYYGYEACCSDTVMAFQSFQPAGYNILVDGGFDC